MVKPVDSAVAERPEVIVAARLRSKEWEKIDAIDDALALVMQNGGGVELPLRHIFTPGLYTREIFIPAGTLATTRIHMKEHPFVISRGVVSVWDDEKGWVKIEAPFTGVTKPGTRRVLFAHEPTIWTTFHVTDKTDPDEVAREVTYSEGRFAELGIASARCSFPVPIS